MKPDEENISTKKDNQDKINIIENILNEDDALDRKYLTTREKIGDFISDHDSAFGCAGLIIVGLFFLGTIYCYNNYMKSSNTNEIALEVQKDIALLEPIYIRTLLPLCDKMNNQNKDKVVFAVENLLLIDYPDKESALKKLNHQMLEAYKNCKTNHEFTNLLLMRLKEIDKKEKITHQDIPTPPKQNTQHTK